MNNPQCPHCGNDDMTMIEIIVKYANRIVYFCNVCSKKWDVMK